MNSLSRCNIDSLPQELLDKIIDEAANSCDRTVRGGFLRTISLTWKPMIPRVQDHLFEKITFYGNSGVENEGLRGFNTWCEDRQERNQELLPDPAAAVKGITYFVLDNDGAPHADANKCLKKFTKVVKLAVARRFEDSNGDIKLESVIVTVLRPQIQFLKLQRCKLDVNDSVSYLGLFPELKYLEMVDIYIKEGSFRNPGPSQPLPKFKGVLRLDSTISRPTSHNVIEMFTSIPTDMEYSHIILGSGVAKRGEAKIFLEPFLLKSKDTLEYLDISSKWGHVDLSDLGNLRKVAIHSYDPPDAQEVIQSLPLERIALLLVVRPAYLDPEFSADPQYLRAWKGLDDFLASYIIERSENNPLRFYVVSKDGYNAAHMDCRTILPHFTARRDVVLVDPSLLNDSHYVDAFDRLQGFDGVRDRYPAGKPIRQFARISHYS